MTDNKEFAKQMRENAVKNEQGNIVCSPELWEEIASVIERAIIPPCKVGDVVYAVGDKDGHHIKECRVDYFHFESAESLETAVWFDCDGNCDGCYFNAYSQSYCGEWDCDNAYGHSGIHISDFGKTVFLTKAEAEEKLKEYNNGTI